MVWAGGGSPSPAGAAILVVVIGASLLVILVTGAQVLVTLVTGTKSLVTLVIAAGLGCDGGRGGVCLDGDRKLLF